MEISDVRRRLRQAIEQARRASEERRVRHDEGARAYDRFLTTVATPVFKLVATSLKAEGYPFRVSTPAAAVRLGSDNANDDYIELTLDTTGDEPEVVGRVSRGRGRRLIRSERPLREGSPIDAITEDDVLEFLADEIVRFVQR
jgi:hypothetical protein